MEDKRAKVCITVKHTRTLLLPTLPNFIRTPGDEAVDVGDLTEEQVREIGAKWTEALVRKSRDRRGDAISRLNREIAKRDEQPCRDCADLAVDGICPNSGRPCGK